MTDDDAYCTKPGCHQPATHQRIVDTIALERDMWGDTAVVLRGSVVPVVELVCAFHAEPGDVIR